VHLAPQLQVEGPYSSVIFAEMTAPSRPHKPHRNRQVYAASAYLSPTAKAIQAAMTCHHHSYQVDWDELVAETMADEMDRLSGLSQANSQCFEPEV
jgi:hypothetical protein